jgi:uncharacterized membrane protein YagU involved in acid resistance
METHRRLSVSAFALAVAEEFVLLVVFTFIAVEFELYNFWAGLLIGFFIHLIVHIVQFLVLRKYIPFTFTTIPAALFSIIAFHDVNFHAIGTHKMVIIWTIVFTLFHHRKFEIRHKAATKFDKWLNIKYLKPE